MRAYLSSTPWMEKDKMEQEKSELRIKFKGQGMEVTMFLCGHSDEDKEVAKDRVGTYQTSTHPQVN